MKKYPLGEFEELVLLTVGVLHEGAYGVAIKDEMEARLQRRISVGALQSALRRMEKKAYLKSQLGEATGARGGKRKRYYAMTGYGKKALVHAKEIRENLWNDLPDIALEF